MNWFTGGNQNDAKKWIGQLTDPTRRERAAQELIRMGAEAAPALVEALQSRDPGLPPIVERLLVHIGSAATPTLIRTLQNAHPLIRAQVVDLLAQIKDPSALPALLDALQGEFYTVRARVCTAFTKMGDPRAIPYLLKTLKDPEPEVRIQAALALGKFRDPSTFDDIAGLLLDDQKIEVRQAAAQALGATRHTAALPYLMEALRDSFWWYEREQAASDLLRAIQQMGPAAVEPLIEALADREGTVRKFAAIVLGELKDIRSVEELGMALYDLHHEVGRVAAESLGKLGAPAVDFLAEALHHPEIGVREHAISGLGMIQDVRVAPLLIGMLQDPERIVQKQAILTLGKLRDIHAQSALKEIANNRADREFSALARDLLNKTA
jgi:HEAT repeat protein